MQTMHKLAAIMVAVSLAGALHAQAATQFIAVIDGPSNVPPNPVPGTGMAVMILNDAQTQLSYTITYQDLIAAETDAHLHNAGARDIGPVAHPLPLGTPKVGVWNISPAMVAELFARRIYINIHSSVYVTGEIRGQVIEDTNVPVQAATWGHIKRLFELDVPR